MAKAAADPRVRAKAADVYEREVKPRAKAAWAEAKPRLEAARDDAAAGAPLDEVDGVAERHRRADADHADGGPGASRAEVLGQPRRPAPGR